MNVPFEKMLRIAGLELNALRASETLGDEFEKVTLPRKGTPVYDVNGAILFYRLKLSRGRSVAGYADIAADDALGEPLLATATGAKWDEKELLDMGTAMAKKGRRGLKFDTIRFVAYSYPKIALQFLQSGKEVLMLELFSWTEVPPLNTKNRKPQEPAHFERWSFLDEMPKNSILNRAKNFNTRLEIWNAPALRRIDTRKILKDLFLKQKFIFKLEDRRVMHYSPRNNDHHVCYELRGQQTNVWCVAASVEMLLNFYRYGYDQVRLASELGLGTTANPNGLPYSRVGDVVTVMENLTFNNLNVTMHTNPGWNLFRDEIRANRPLISFVPGHSRTVAGYTQSLFSMPNQIPFRGLLVYDPWPPNAGVITRWENFNVQTYQFAYSSVLRHR